MEGIAEELLKNLQRQLLSSTQKHPSDSSSPTATPRQAMRAVERAYGPMSTQYGRRLQDLLAGSHAWELFEKSRPRKNRLPQMRELGRSEPLLRIMRESGELAEREVLLLERDAALVEIWKAGDLGEVERQERAQAVYDSYFASVTAIADRYRPHYQKLRRATGAVPPLVGPRVRSRPLLQPPIIAHLFGACHSEKDYSFEVEPTPNASLKGREPEILSFVYRAGRNTIRVRSTEDGDAVSTLEILDDMAWDVAAIAVSAFHLRTPGNDIDVPFPLLIDDYFEWRGVDPRKRTIELRKQIDIRIRLLCSDHVDLHTETDLWLADSQTGRRKKTAIVSDGTFLARRSALYRQSAWQSEIEHQPLYGYLVSLGEWARKFIEQRAMIGIFPKQLAEYDLRRAQWERRIGWYVTFQMHNQGSRMTFEDITDNGKPSVRVTPQHPLRMRTVLMNSRVHWEEMARTNPGKVIKQWTDALENLRKDGVLGEYRCLDGAADGSDLPVRSRLSTMLEYRYEFTPGKDLIKHLRVKTAHRLRNRG